MKLLLHPVSQERYDLVIKNPPQSLVLVSPKGSGKYTLLHGLANVILGYNPAGRLFELLPPKDKQTIGIEQIRELKNTFRLKSKLVRVVLINDAGLMTKEAQNSLLKLLEEPPKKVHFLLGVSSIRDVLETIQSRSAIWRLVLPTKAQIKDFYSNIEPARLNKAIAIATNKMGIINELVSDDEQNVILQSIDSAKDILAENQFNRLIRANTLSKDSEKSGQIVGSLVLVCHAALINASMTKPESVKIWNKRLKLCLKSENWLNNNIQTKLVLSYLFIVL
ncbi:MAG: hypothetical protein WCP03_04265 [Candidatus Saccharibacteria bacterium]